MTYRDLIIKVQHYSGFSDHESEESLKFVVQTLAVELMADEREDFASLLPAELQDVALTETEADLSEFDNDIYAAISEKEGIDESRAERQVRAVWQALKDCIDSVDIAHIRAGLPRPLALELR